MSKGFQLTSKNEGVEKYLWEQIKKHNIETHVLKAWKMARLFGGSAIVFGFNDGRDSREPLNKFAIQSINWVRVLDRWQLTPITHDRNFESPTYGQPENYQVTSFFGGGSIPNIHASRVIVFDGLILDDYEYLRNNYWHQSVLENCYDHIRNFASVHNANASLICDFSQTIIKLNNLSELLSQEQDGLVKKRLELVDKMRSTVNAIIIETGEEFSRQTTTVTGLSDLVQITKDRVVSASGMPHNIILGDGAKGGMGANGETENRDWYDSIAMQQSTYLYKKLCAIFDLFLLQKSSVTNGLLDNSLELTFNPLWAEPESSKIANRKSQAETDSIYISSGVLNPEEVAASRFGGTEYSIETKLEQKNVEIS
jgi:phage-related protein (TIGR01555 family)